MPGAGDSIDATNPTKSIAPITITRRELADTVFAFLSFAQHVGEGDYRKDGDRSKDSRASDAELRGEEFGFVVDGLHGHRCHALT